MSSIMTSEGRRVLVLAMARWETLGQCSQRRKRTLTSLQPSRVRFRNLTTHIPASTFGAMNQTKWGATAFRRCIKLTCFSMMPIEVARSFLEPEYEGSSSLSRSICLWNCSKLERQRGYKTRYKSKATWVWENPSMLTCAWTRNGKKLRRINGWIHKECPSVGK